MALITMPTCPSVKWWNVQPRLASPSQQTASQWTGRTKTQPSGHAWMSFSVSLPPMDETQGRQWRAFFGSLMGRLNTFQLPLVHASQSSATCLVNGAGQTGYSFAVDGLGAAGAKLSAGQWATVGGQALLLTADLVANGSGQGTIYSAIPLRASPSDNAVVTISRPYATCSLLSDEVGWDTNFALPLHNFSFSCREAF